MLCCVAIVARGRWRVRLAFEAAPVSPVVDFATFCLATRAWLGGAPSPDAALVAAADLLEGGLDPSRLEGLCAEADDAHTLLGAHALRGLLDLVQTLHS